MIMECCSHHMSLFTIELQQNYKHYGVVYLVLFAVVGTQAKIDANVYFYGITFASPVTEPFTSAISTFVLNIRISFPVENDRAYFDNNITTEMG